MALLRINVALWLHPELNRRLTYFRLTFDSGHSARASLLSEVERTCPGPVDFIAS